MRLNYWPRRVYDEIIGDHVYVADGLLYREIRGCNIGQRIAAKLNEVLADHTSGEYRLVPVYDRRRNMPEAYWQQIGWRVHVRDLADFVLLRLLDQDISN